ncbi:MAG: hypothetical protein WCD76_03125 [Pyrinomonadaceae bacterium]
MATEDESKQPLAKSFQVLSVPKVSAANLVKALGQIKPGKLGSNATDGGPISGTGCSLTKTGKENDFNCTDSD